MQRKTDLLAALFLLFFLAQGVALIRETSPTTDEVAFHMVNGYTYLKTGDYRMSPANPAFLREWMALPWLFLNPKLDLNKPAWRQADSVPFSREVFYRDNRAIANRLLYASRGMILVLGLALGVVVYAWAKSLHGPAGGLMSLAFYAMCPNLVAHSSITHTDIGVTLFVTLAGFGLWRYLETGRTRDFVFLAAAFGAACASKHNALVFFAPFLGVFWLKRGFKVFLKAFFWLPLSAFLFIWASYGFEFKPLLWEAVPRMDEKISYVSAFAEQFFPGRPEIRAWILRAAQTVPVPIPSYLLGLAGLVRSHHAPYWHYSFGQWTNDGTWYFYLYSFAAKMSLPFLALLALRFFYFKKASSPAARENVIILPAAGFLVASTFGDRTGIGIRYLFPMIPMLMVWIGGLGRLAETSGRWKKFLAAAIVLNAATIWPSFPNYLSYFNPAAGGTEGGLRQVRGSDVDWGQGLKALKRYMDRNGIDKVSLRYFGTADPSFYGIESEPVTEAETKKPSAKVYAVSVFFREHVQWFERYKPDALVGGSIHVYDLRGKV